MIDMFIIGKCELCNQDVVTHTNPNATEMKDLFIINHKCKLLIIGFDTMKIEFDTKREEEIFRNILKDADLNNMRPELMAEAYQLIQKMVDYYA